MIYTSYVVRLYVVDKRSSIVKYLLCNRDYCTLVYIVIIYIALFLLRNLIEKKTSDHVGTRRSNQVRVPSRPWRWVFSMIFHDKIMLHIYIYIYIYIYTCLIEKNGTLIVYYLFPRVLIFPN